MGMVSGSRDSPRQAASSLCTSSPLIVPPGSQVHGGLGAVGFLLALKEPGPEAPREVWQRQRSLIGIWMHAPACSMPTPVVTAYCDLLIYGPWGLARKELEGQTVCTGTRQILAPVNES